MYKAKLLTYKGEAVGLLGSAEVNNKQVAI
jgi:hypothetical protein